MKKQFYSMIAMILILLLIFATSACSGDNDVASVISTIDAIGEVTIDSASAIESAEAAYNSLPDDKKEKVTNYDTLVAACEQYDIVCVEAAIDRLGKISLDSFSAIESAEAAYNGLPGKSRAQVGNYDVLVAAREQYDVMYVVAAIDEIGDLNLVEYENDKYFSIKTAMEAYNSMNQSQQAAVDNYETLQEAVFVITGLQAIQGWDYFVFSHENMTIEKVGDPNYFDNPQLYSALIEAVNKTEDFLYERLEIPATVVKKIGTTAMKDGVQTEQCGNISVTWSFDPTRDNHLYLLFEYRPAK